MSQKCFINIGQLAGVEAADQSKKWVAGNALSKLPIINNAYLLIEDERIKDFGPMDEAPVNADQFHDLEGRSVLPAWCDSHTHLVWAGSREQEFVDRIKGLSYEEIAKRGGGILNSARQLQETAEEQLYEAAYERLQEVISYGTGAIEIKSGYGLTEEAEYKMLRVIRKLKGSTNIPIRATFLGAHAIPKEYQNKRHDYIDLIKEKMIPHIAREGLADYCDVFCDRGFFTPEETDEILQTADKFGLPPKIHANELDYSGGIQVGVKNNAVSVDHLECTGDEEIRALLGSKTMPTLLPGTAFFLGLEYPPARKMIDSGLPVALATDYNPGSTPSGRFPFVISLACIKLKMLPEEAIQAATLNGAYAMEWSDELGTIKRGKWANFIIAKSMPSLAYFPYAYGKDHIDQVFIKGQLQ